MYQLNSESDLPYYQQIIHELIEAIQSGELLPEERLPAERKLAQLYGVNRSTVGRALDELVSLGWLERQQGSGTYISATRIANRKSPQLPWKNLLARPIFVEDPYLAELKTKRNEKDCIDLSSGDLPLSFIQNFNIPSLSWEQVLKMQADLPESGEIHLRHALVNHLKSQYQLSLSAEELLITSGSTQGMSLIFDTLLKPGDVVATENPSFLFSLPWIASNQIELFKICPIVTICLGEQVCSRIGPVGASARSVTGEGAPDDAPCDCDSENCPPASPVAPSVLVLNMTDPLTGTDQSVRTVRSLRNPR